MRLAPHPPRSSGVLGQHGTREWIRARAATRRWVGFKFNGKKSLHANGKEAA